MSHFDLVRASALPAALPQSSRPRALVRQRPARLAAARLPRVSPTALALALVGSLGIMYVALMAIVMSYAAHTIGFAQSVRDDEASVATLEANYLAGVSAVTTTDYAASGYAKPATFVYVPKAPATALR